MKKGLKIAGIIVGVGLLLFVALIAVIYILFPPAKVMHRIETEVENATQRDVTIGSARLSFKGGVGFQLENFTISSPANFEDAGDMIQLGKLDIKVNLGQLLAKQLVINDIQINDVTLNLRVKADSTTNFTFGKETPTGTEGEDKPPTTPETATLPATFAVPLKIHNANITYVDETTAKSVRLQQIDSQITLKADHPTQTIDLAMTLTIPAGDILQNGASIAPFDLFPMNVEIENQIKLADQQYDLTKLTINIGQIALHATSNGAWRENQFELTDLTANYGNTRLGFSANLTNLKQNTGTYTLQLYSDLGELKRQLPLKLPLAKVEGTINGQFTGTIPTGTTLPLAAVLPAGNLNLNQITLQVDEKLPAIEQISGTLHLADQHLQLENFTAQIGESQLGFQLSSNLAPLHKLEDWEQLVLQYALIGDIDLAQVKAQAPPEFPLDTLAGRIKLNLSDRIHPKRDLQDVSQLVPKGSVIVENVRASFPPQDSLPPITDLDATLDLAGEGRIRIRQIHANVNQNPMDITGSADLRQFKTIEDLDKIQIEIAFNSPQLDLQSLLPPPNPEKKDVVIPPLPTIHGTANINTLIVDKIPVKNINARIAVQNQIIEIEDLDLNVFGGSVDLQSRFNLADTTYQMTTRVERMQANDFFTTLFEPVRNVVYGTLNFNADVSGRTFDPDSIKQNLVSHGRLEIQNGQVMNLDMLKEASRVVSVFNFDTIDFTDAFTNFTVEDGKYSFGQLDIHSNDADYYVTGYCTLDGALNYKVRVLLSKARTEPINIPQKDLFLSEDGRFIIDLNIGGMFTRPKVTWDKTGTMERAKQKVKDKATEEAGKLLDNVEDKIDEQLQDKLGSSADSLKEQGKNVLKGLFGR